MKRIMVVDEEPRVCMLYEEVLSDLGYQVYFTMSTIEAWEFFREYRPDLVIMDLDMSDSRSPEVLKKMRGLDPNVPIFVSSVHQAVGKDPSLASIGVAAVFTKPIDIGILRLWLERTLRGERADSPTAG